jgi:hypothetical protein
MTQVQASQNPSADYLQAEEFRAYVEREVLSQIRELVLKGTIQKDRVQAMAKEVLLLVHPGMSIDELYINATKIDDTFSELGPVVIKIMQAYEEKYNKQAVQEVSSLIKKGNYEDAQNMVMKVLMYKGI